VKEAYKVAKDKKAIQAALVPLVPVDSRAQQDPTDIQVAKDPLAYPVDKALLGQQVQLVQRVPLDHKAPQELKD